MHIWGLSPWLEKAPVHPYLAKLTRHFCSVVLSDSACRHSFLLFSDIYLELQSLRRSTVIITILACLWRLQGRPGEQFILLAQNPENTLHHSLYSLKGGRAGTVLRSLPAEPGRAGHGTRRPTDRSKSWLLPSRLRHLSAMSLDELGNFLEPWVHPLLKWVDEAHLEG